MQSSATSSPSGLPRSLGLSQSAPPSPPASHSVNGVRGSSGGLRNYRNRLEPKAAHPRTPPLVELRHGFWAPYDCARLAVRPVSSTPACPENWTTLGPDEQGAGYVDSYSMSSKTAVAAFT